MTPGEVKPKASRTNMTPGEVKPKASRTNMTPGEVKPKASRTNMTPGEVKPKAVRAEEIRVTGARPGLVARVRALLDREEILGPVFVTPALLLLLLLVAYPFVVALYFSMSNAFIGRPSEFIGFRNFV